MTQPICNVKRSPDGTKMVALNKKGELIVSIESPHSLDPAQDPNSVQRMRVAIGLREIMLALDPTIRVP